MSTSLDTLRQGLAKHDAALTVFLCERALCVTCAPAAYPSGWVQRLYAELEDVSPGPALVAEFVPLLEQGYRECVLPALTQTGITFVTAATVQACDVACLHALLLRLRFAVLVAESKIKAADVRLRTAAAAGDTAGLNDLITYPIVERAVIERARGHVAEFARHQHLPPGQTAALSSAVAAVYRDWILPLSRDVQVSWLIAHAR